MKKTILTSVMLAALASPAFAHQCPALMGEIDAALATSTVDETTKAQIMELYASGKAKHESGDHDGSVTDLTAAKELLGL